MNHITTQIVDKVAYVSTVKFRDLTHREIGEFDSREFLGDDWKRMKTDLDGLLAFRKTIKQKPTYEQRMILDMNQYWINYYNSILFHSPRLASINRCDCHRCGKKRTNEMSSVL